ncbi:MAG: APC family permease [Puniceicoccales bacterium]
MDSNFKPHEISTTPRRKLGLWSVALIMFGITTTLHGLSPLATYGLGALFYLGLAVFGFLVPAGMAAAELATGWSREGGVYIWVSEAFGMNLGFLAAWLQWLQNLIFWTVLLTGAAAMLALGFGAEPLAHNKWFIVAVVLGSIWLTTLLTARGLHHTKFLGVIGSLIGTILPGVILVVLAVVYLANGKPDHLSLAPGTLLPDLTQMGNLSFAISTIMIFAGVELMGARIDVIRDPGKNFPRASFLAITMTILLLAPVTLAIAVLVPKDELNIAAGLVQAVQTIFPSGSALAWVPAFFAVALLLDSIGEIAGWMAGTPITMERAGRDGFLPAKLGGRTGDVAPAMLYFQAVIGSLITVFFTVIPDVQGVFWLLAALLVQLYVVMYFLMFAALWRLRRTQPDQPRAYRIPGGMLGVSLVCGVGLIGCLAVFAFGFIRPSSLTQISEVHYLRVLCTGLGISFAAPIGLMIWRAKRLTSSRSRPA